MVDLLRSLHKYVPRNPTTEAVEVPGCNTPLEMTKSNFFKTGFGEFLFVQCYWGQMLFVLVCYTMCNGSLEFPQRLIFSQRLISQTDWTTTKPSIYMYTVPIKSYSTTTHYINTTSLVRPTLLFSQPTRTYLHACIQSKPIQFKFYICVLTLSHSMTPHR